MLSFLAISQDHYRICTEKLHSLKSLLNYLSNGTKTKSFSQSSVVLQHFEFEQNALRISEFFANSENSVALKGLKKHITRCVFGQNPFCIGLCQSHVT